MKEVTVNLVSNAAYFDFKIKKMDGKYSPVIVNAATTRFSLNEGDYVVYWRMIGAAGDTMKAEAVAAGAVLKKSPGTIQPGETTDSGPMYFTVEA